MHIEMTFLLLSFKTTLQLFKISGTSLLNPVDVGVQKCITGLFIFLKREIAKLKTTRCK